MSILTGKLKKEIEDMYASVDVQTPKDRLEHDKILHDAQRTSSLPSEIQKTMSEILADRLKQSTVKNEEDETMMKRVKKAQDTGLVNMGSTMVKGKGEERGKSKLLG